jgi:HPt (histidine-containing phosphotransfer) domain-containing protein
VRYKFPFAPFARLARFTARHGQAVSMSSPNEAFLAFLEQQRVDYCAALPQRWQQIESHWRQLLSGEAPEQALDGLERCAHGLAGSGATFGCTAMGDAARLLELAVDPLRGSAHALSPESLAVLTQAVEALRRSFPDAS